MTSDLEVILEQLYLAVDGILKSKCKDESLLHLEEAIDGLSKVIYKLKASVPRSPCLSEKIDIS